MIATATLGPVLLGPGAVGLILLTAGGQILNQTGYGLGELLFRKWEAEARSTNITTAHGMAADSLALTLPQLAAFVRDQAESAASSAREVAELGARDTSNAATPPPTGQ